MGNQEKAELGDTVIATSTRLFQVRVVKDSAEKKGESLLSSTPVVVLSTILGRTPNIEEYQSAVKGINRMVKETLCSSLMHHEMTLG